MEAKSLPLLVKFIHSHFICTIPGDLDCAYSHMSVYQLLFSILIYYYVFRLQKEYALPEQYKTIWSGKKFVTEPSDINS